MMCLLLPFLDLLAGMDYVCEQRTNEHECFVLQFSQEAGLASSKLSLCVHTVVWILVPLAMYA